MLKDMKMPADSYQPRRRIINLYACGGPLHSPDLPLPPTTRLATAKVPFPAIQVPRRSRRWLVFLSVAALLATMGTLAAGQPGWLVRSWLEAESLEVSEASLRLAIVRERQRVEAYRVLHGQLPPTLEAAGGSVPGVRYLLAPDGTYLLEADLGRSYVRLASTGSVQAFLGNSLQVILSRPTG